ncbi:MAG: hypothetical protein WD058_07890 [Dehalococcoidia bacterium]
MAPVTRGRIVRAFGAAFLIATALVFGACNDDAPESAGAALAERWLRLGEDSQTNVVVYERALPPALSDLLNPSADADTPEEDRLAIAVHPRGDLLGSYLQRRTDGSHLVWLFYDVEDTELAPLTAEVSEQLDETPWQVVGEQGNLSYTVVRFQGTTGEDVTGTAIIEPSPPGGTFAVVVSREGGEETLQVPRAASAPLLEAQFEDDLTVTRVFPGLARSAGLQVDDRVTSVAGEAVASPADVTRVLDGLAVGPGQVSVTYLLEIAAPGSLDEPPFVARPGLTLPRQFPLRDAWADLTVDEYQTLVDPSGRFFAASMLTAESTTDAVARVRAALEDAGWEIVSDEPVGFATSIEFANEDERLMGAAQIDLFEEDESFTHVVLQFQTAPPAGN